MPTPFNPRPKALNVFVVAEQFRNASKLLAFNQMGRIRLPFELDTPLIGPVCSAFASELYFKCLIRLRRKPISNAHDLQVLFGMLSTVQQSKIIKFFEERSHNTRGYVEREYEKQGRNKPNFDFDFCLNASRSEFVRLRYIHERGVETGFRLARRYHHGRR